ncbi:hypothetical protein MiSe_70550 [Microseira wollei NIES-4236]|uniref:Uncharacterized protein n=1 Tax=Microseira wollei NIES-4236 TaxID=2530354 RepID=A0AAV3XL41_9CYAN|nr:hypothetical protein MiSe_70550 [Microseira wollei NIES-4236]
MDGLQSDKGQSRQHQDLHMNYSIRLETESDYRETEMITRESFWDVYKPGCDEHLILHKIIKVKAFVKELDVVCHINRILTNVIY